MWQEKSWIPLWNYMLNSLICMACKNLFFMKGKKAVYEESFRSVPRAMFNPWFAQNPSEVLFSASAEESELLHYWLQILTNLNQGSMGEG